MPDKNQRSKQIPTKPHTVLAAERHQRIVSRARQTGTVRVAELAREFGVADETIRRDLDLLANRGQLSRTHGGAFDPTGALAEPPYLERAARQGDEKRRIATAAARLCEPGETVLIDASSSALAMATRFPAGLRVVTYSLAALEHLAARTDLEVIQLGGAYEPRGRRFSGLLTENALRSLRIDRFFFSGGGFDPRLGISEPNPGQATLKSLILAHAGWSCALIDHTKFGLRSEWFFAKPADFQMLVTDRPAGLRKPPFKTLVAR